MTHPQFFIAHPPSTLWPVPKEVLQHSGSILGSVILCGTFRRISQLWTTHIPQTWRTFFVIYRLQYHNFFTLSYAWSLILFSIAWQRTHSISTDIRPICQPTLDRYSADISTATRLGVGRVSVEHRPISREGEGDSQKKPSRTRL